MSKKMHDIISPKHRAAKAVVLEKKVGRRPTGVKKRKTTLKPEVLAEAKKEFLERKEGRFPLKEIVAGAVVLALLLGAYGFLKLPKATVQMWPVMETVTLQEKVLASTSKQEPVALESTIPAPYPEVRVPYQNKKAPGKMWQVKKTVTLKKKVFAGPKKRERLGLEQPIPPNSLGKMGRY